MKKMRVCIEKLEKGKDYIIARYPVKNVKLDKVDMLFLMLENDSTDLRPYYEITEKNKDIWEKISGVKMDLDKYEYFLEYYSKEESPKRKNKIKGKAKLFVEKYRRYFEDDYKDSYITAYNIEGMDLEELWKIFPEWREDSIDPMVYYEYVITKKQKSRLKKILGTNIDLGNYEYVLYVTFVEDNIRR